ncbi:MAG: hypothetical protein ACOC4Y_02285 [bacterium]
MSTNGRYVKLASKFWTDEKIIDLALETKFLFIYILSSPHSNMAGYYRLPKPYIKADLKLTDKQLGKGFTKLLNKGLIKYCEHSSVILIPKFFKYNSIQNKNMAKGAASRTSELPRNSLVEEYKNAVNNYADKYKKELLEGLPKQLNEPLPEQSNQVFGNKEQEKEQEKEKDIEKEKECEKKHSSPSTVEKKILNIFKSVDNYPFDYETDLEHIREISTDYPDIDLLEKAKEWKTYKKDNPLKKKSNPRLQFRNWCKKAHEWAQEDKQNNSPGKSQKEKERYERIKQKQLKMARGEA